MTSELARSGGKGVVIPGDRVRRDGAAPALRYVDEHSTTVKIRHEPDTAPRELDSARPVSRTRAGRFGGTTMMKPLLVGELNPLSSNPHHALYPRPKSGSGGRLCRILGLTEMEYLDRYQTINLCTGEWSMADALKAAQVIHALSLDTDRAVVLLGSKVCRAFGVRYEPMTLYRMSGYTVVRFPHPSGLCRTWNDKAKVRFARELMKSVGAL